MRTKRYIVYGLVDPSTLLVRYIGKSSSGLKRPLDHTRRRRNASGPYCRNWIGPLTKLGMVPLIVELSTSSAPTHCEDERWWIAYGRASGWPLTNLTDGGEGAPGRSVSDDTRWRIGEKSRGRKHPEEVKARIGESLRGRPMSDATRRALDKWNDELRGKPRSDATKAKISAKNAGRKHTLETRTKISANLSGRSGTPHTAETKALLSRLALGRGVGVPKSAETRKRMSEGAKARWAHARGQQ